MSANSPGRGQLEPGRIGQAPFRSEAWDGSLHGFVVFRPRRCGETQQLGPSIVVGRAVTSGPCCHRMMFFPGGEGEGRVRVLPIGSGEAGQHGCGAAECSRGRDQLVASWPGLERVAIRMPGIGLGNVETCDNTATTDTGDSMGGVPNDPQADSSTSDLSAQRQRPSIATRISVIGPRSVQPLSGGPR